KVAGCMPDLFRADLCRPTPVMVVGEFPAWQGLALLSDVGVGSTGNVRLQMAAPCGAAILVLLTDLSIELKSITDLYPQPPVALDPGDSVTGQHPGPLRSARGGGEDRQVRPIQRRTRRQHRRG